MVRSGEGASGCAKGKPALHCFMESQETVAGVDICKGLEARDVCSLAHSQVHTWILEGHHSVCMHL